MKRRSNLRLSVCIFFLLPALAFSQSNEFKSIRAEVRFDKALRTWDGFGINYVEEAQSRDINNLQDYGGFSLIDESEKQKIIDLVFGENGLKPGIVKMFLDPFHQSEQGGPYDHQTTASNMRYFARHGLEKTRSWGGDLSVITTLYGPPAYLTKQKVIRGRDFNPDYKQDLANYYIDWVKFLKEEDELPVKYVSLHNEGEDWQRWPADGSDNKEHYNHDYNLFWSPEMLTDFLAYLPKEFRKAGISDVKLTPGETYGWDHFVDWGYADAIAENSEALSGIGLITAHGFMSCGFGKWNNIHTSNGIDILQELRPELHAWVTSTSWKNMDVDFIREIWGNVMVSKANAIIPWAGIQRPGKWLGGDPNSGCAIWVHDNGKWEIRKGYHYYKQVCRAGQPGMKVCKTTVMDATVKVLGFSSANTVNPDAFVVINVAETAHSLDLKISGTDAKSFKAYTTSDPEFGDMNYEAIGVFSLDKEGKFSFTVPARSVTTFYGVSSDTEESSCMRDVELVEVRSGIDNELQKCYFYKTGSSESQPLIVSLHTWSGEFSSYDALANLCKEKDLNYIHPDFRGANNNADACCSELAIADIDDAITYAIRHSNVDTANIFVIGKSGGGYATISTFMRSRHNIKKFSAWVPITDLIAWYNESTIRNSKYAKDILDCTSSEEELNIEIAKQRSPLYLETPVNKLEHSKLFIYTGLYDGIQGSVPISHSINFYNKILTDLAVLDSSAYVSPSEKLFLLEKRQALSDLGAIADRKVCLKKEYGNLKLIVFEGNHEMLPEYALNELLED